MGSRAWMRTYRISRDDWVGDAVLMLAVGLLGLAAVFLPWANVLGRGGVDFSLSKPATINAALQTPWGLPALLAALGVISVAVCMLLFGPRASTAVLSLAPIAAGAVFLVEALGAFDGMGLAFRAGLGLYLTLLAGILLIPIGVASPMVGYILIRRPSLADPRGSVD
jgi:hypothetical protein